MSDLIEMEARLRRTYRAIANQVTATSEVDAPERPASEPPPYPSTTHVATRPRHMLRIAAALLLVLGVAAVAVRARVVDRTEPPGSVGAGVDRGRWEELPEPPIATLGYGTAWTGSEAIVYGGFTNARSTAVAAYDPERRTWRRLADLPDELAGAGLDVWTGSRLVVFATNAGREVGPGVAASYDPATDQWEVLSNPAIPQLFIESYVLWTGDRALVVGFHTGAEDEANTQGRGAALYDPTTDQWTELPPAPRPLTASSDAVWTGRELLWVGQDWSSGRLAALALDPKLRTWRELPAPPLVGREVPFVAWTGSELVVAGGSTPPSTQDEGKGLYDAAAFDPVAGTWTPYPAAPLAPSGNDVNASPVLGPVGKEIIAIAGRDPEHRPVILDPTIRTWRVGAPAPSRLQPSGRVVIPIGDELLVLGRTGPNQDRSTPAVFSYRPSS